MSAEEEGSKLFWRADFNQYLYSGVPPEQSMLDYFAESVFYDEACDNEIIQMQFKVRCDKEHLEKMTGIQYVVRSHKDGEVPLTIIDKLQRNSQTEVKYLAVYYILRGVIYRSPSFLSVLEARLCNTLYYINEAIHQISDDEEKLRAEHLQNAEPQHQIAIPSVYNNITQKAIEHLETKFSIPKPTTVPQKRSFTPSTPVESKKPKI